MSSGRSNSFRASCDNDGMLSVSWGSIRGIMKDVDVMFVWEEMELGDLSRGALREVKCHVTCGIESSK